MPKSPVVAIVGAGPAGLCIAIGLKEKLGITTFTLFDAQSDVGGTWEANKYPGCTCDVPGHFYSYSFAPNPNWTMRFPKQPEIRAYFQTITSKYDLWPHIKLKTEVISTIYNDQEQNWTVTYQTQGHEVKTMIADIVVSSVGQLNRPKYPDIPGLESFAGGKFHSARWNFDVDIEDKNVAVIGTGASAVQFIPQIAPKVKKLTIFQRSAHWIHPRDDYRYWNWIRTMFQYVPLARWLYRFYIYVYSDWLFFYLFARAKPVEELVKKACIDHAKAQLGDRKDLIASQIPDYPPGCTRLLFVDDYYPTLVRDNVQVVTDPIDHIEANSIVTHDASGKTSRHDADVLILATGFRSTEMIQPMIVKGKNGVDLEQKWNELGGAEAYLGMTVDDFPSWFCTYGPNTNLGHSSIIFMIECQSNYIIKCIRAMMNQKSASLEVKPEAITEFNHEIQQELSKMVWNTNCISWYKNEKGKVTQNWSTSIWKYWWRTSSPKWNDYKFEGRADWTSPKMDLSWLSTGLMVGAAVGVYGIVTGKPWVKDVLDKLRK